MRSSLLESLLDRAGHRFPGHVMRRLLLPDGRFRYAYASPRIRESFGLDTDAIVAEDPATHSWIHPDDRTRFEDALRVSARELSDLDEEVRVTASDGRTRWVRSLGSPKRLADGTVAWDGIALDVTERRELAEVLNRTLRLAREVEARGLPAAPAEVVAALEVLDHEALSPEGRAALSVLRRSFPSEGPVMEEGLTTRQKEVQALLARGMTNREIGERLGIAEGTAKLHVSAVLKRLGVSNRVLAALPQSR